MCLSYERKHQIIKNFREFNFKNTPLTAIKHLLHNTAASIHDDEGIPHSNFFEKSFQITEKKDHVYSVSISGVVLHVNSILADFEKKRFLIIKSLDECHINKIIVRKLNIDKYRNGVYYCSENDEGGIFTIPCISNIPWPMFKCIRGHTILVVPPVLPYAELFC